MSLERKIETIEGEMGVMKGEIKQTLVDLREFIMRQGSPFASAEAGPAVGAPPTDLQRLLREARESVREEASASVRSEVEALRQEAESLSTNEPASASGQDVAATAATEEPLPPPAQQPAAERGPEQPRVVRIQQTAPAAGQEAERVSISPAADMDPAFGPLDANLLTNLMRWVGGVKRRLGASQLPGFLEMYKLTGHLPPVMEKLIYHLAELDALPDESYDQIFTLDDLMDSLLQLHAIVYGPGYVSSGALLSLEEEKPQGTAEEAEAEDRERLDKVLTTALLTIAAIVAAVMVVNAILPAVSTGSASIVSSSRTMADRIGTAIEIIHVAPPSDGEVRFWVKNIGKTEIQDIRNADVFVEGSSEYRMKSSGEGTSCPANPDDEWYFAYEDDNDFWIPSTTVKITICVSSGTSTRVYFTTANGGNGQGVD